MKPCILICCSRGKTDKDGAETLLLCAGRGGGGGDNSREPDSHNANEPLPTPRLMGLHLKRRLRRMVKPTLMPSPE